MEQYAINGGNPLVGEVEIGGAKNAALPIMAGAILTENVNAIKSVKGIGLKTAQRVIIELKDKIAVTGSAEEMNFGASVAIKEEALAALVMLGFVKAQANKVLDKIMAGGGVTSVEELIKQALKQL